MQGDFEQVRRRSRKGYILFVSAMVEKIIMEGVLKVALGICMPREEHIHTPQEEINSMLHEATIHTPQEEIIRTPREATIRVVSCQ